MGLVNDFNVYKQDKFESLSTLFEYVEEGEVIPSTFTVTYDAFDSPTNTIPREGISSLSRSVIYSVITEASLYQLGVSRFKYIDWMKCDVTLTDNTVTIHADAWYGYDNVNDCEGDDYWEGEVTFTYAYTPEA